MFLWPAVELLDMCCLVLRWRQRLSIVVIQLQQFTSLAANAGLNERLCLMQGLI
jgi:hypothetical protein